MGVSWGEPSRRRRIEFGSSRKAPDDHVIDLTEPVADEEVELAEVAVSAPTTA